MVNQLIKECNLNVGYIENIKKSVSIEFTCIYYRKCIVSFAQDTQLSRTARMASV